MFTKYKSQTNREIDKVTNFRYHLEYFADNVIS